MRTLWAAVLATAMAGAAWAQAPERDAKSEQEDLKRKVDYLMEKNRQAEAAKPAQAEPPKGGNPVIEAYFKDGFRFKSSDGNLEGKIGGRVMEHLRFVKNRSDGNTPGGTSPNTFTFKENYIQLDGTIYKDFEYKLQANFFPAGGNAGPFASLSDTYLGWRPAKEIGFRFGQMEVPFSQEQIESTLYIDLVERSVANRLSPVRDLGAEVYGSFADGIVQYEAGIFNGTMIGGSSNTRNLNDNNDEKEFAARLRFMPFRTGGPPWIRQLRVGVAGTYSYAGGSFGTPETLPQLSSPESSTTWAAYIAGTSNLGKRTRLGAELSYIYGPFGLRAEVMKMSLDATPATANSPDQKVDLTGYYVLATFILTGEDKADEGRLSPAHPINLSEGHFGAFELAARVSGVDASDVLDEGFITTGTNDKVTAYTLGVNWWLVRNVRISFNWVHNTFAEPLVSGPNRIRREDAVLIRFQIDF